MIDGQRILAMIPARGGSKGVPGKNTRPLGGRPLIAWTIAAARQSRLVDRLVLSSEDSEIIRVAREWGCEAPFVRPPALARDDTPGIEPVRHCVGALPGYDYVVVLQPTSPFRTAEDIDGAITACVRAGADSLVSVSEVWQHPAWMYTREADGRLSPLLSDAAPARRQDLSPVFALNGAIYVLRCAWLATCQRIIGSETIGYVMDRRRAIDIDTALDFTIAEALADTLVGEDTA
ncbi:MAG: acylneuraminate cytidylyltransferase family protein [Alphaproteobacteria bacterium]|nr:MAG: acylneuraminate cytidylyltransferase family protein [Alphaproteobacteria bacterium]